MLQILKPEFLQKVKDDELLQAQIGNATKKKMSTVKRWISENHMMLSHATVIQVIREYAKVPKNVELTMTASEAAA